MGCLSPLLGKVTVFLINTLLENGHIHLKYLNWEKAKGRKMAKGKPSKATMKLEKLLPLPSERNKNVYWYRLLIGYVAGIWGALGVMGLIVRGSLDVVKLSRLSA